jgi:outer membrane protein TolC
MLLKTVRLLAVSVSALALAGCMVQTQTLSLGERSAMLSAERIAMFAEQEPVATAISLDEAMARTLKYNLDNRVKLMEVAVAQGQLDLASFELLPDLAVSAGYNTRSNILASRSKDLTTGTVAPSYSTSSDQSSGLADLSMSWNVLDFGVSYFAARQQSDRLLVAKEQRRKVVHLLMQQVRQAYWEAVGAQRMERLVGPLLSQAQSALASSRNIESDGLSAPVDQLTYQRELIGLVLQLETIRDQLLQAKPKLASLMNIEPGRPFTLSAPERLPTLSSPVGAADMYEYALLYRPEILEAGYNQRIGIDETQRAMASLLPGLSIKVGANADSNSFLLNNEWQFAGIQVSWNLLNLLNAGAIRNNAEAKLTLAQHQKMALHMAVLTQTHIAWLEYQGRKRQFDLNRELNTVEQRILEHTRNATEASAQGKLAEIRAATAALTAQLRLYQSYSAYQGAYGQLVTSLGIDPVAPEIIENLSGYDLESLRAAIAQGGIAVTPMVVAQQ